MEIKSILGEKLMKDLGFGALTQEEQNGLLARIATVVFQAAVVRAVATMNESDRDELEKLLSREKNEEKILGFIEKKAPDMKELIKEELEDFREEAGAFTKTAKLISGAAAD